MTKYHGAKDGYEPPDAIQQEIDVRDLPINLTPEESKARRIKNQEREKSRARHRKRKGHGR